MSTLKLGHRKIVKSLKQLKRHFVESKKILTPFDVPKAVAYQDKGRRDDANVDRGNTLTENKHTFGKIVDYAKYMVNKKFIYNSKDTDVRHLLSLINKAQFENSGKKHLNLSRKNIEMPLLSKCTRRGTNSGQFMNYSCSAKDDCSKPNVVRHKYHEELETGINNQIIAEFSAAFTYLSMSCFFGRIEVALPGTQQFFMTMYNEENEHALMLIRYQQLRGGHVKLGNIPTLENTNWCSIYKALEVALEMEKLVCDKILNLVEIARKHNDSHAEDFLVTNFVQEQYKSNEEFGKLLARANRIGHSGMSEHFFDKEMALVLVRNKK